VRFTHPTINQQPMSPVGMLPKIREGQAFSILSPTENQP
jgi:hypothetical protein